MLANTRYANTGAISAATRMDPTQPIYSADEKFQNFGGYFQWLKDGKDLNDPTWPYITERNAVRNPVAMLEQFNDKAKSKSAIGNIELDYKIHGLEDLRLHMNFGADLSTGKQTTWESPNASGDNAYYGWDGWNKEDKYNLSYNVDRKSVV